MKRTVWIRADTAKERDDRKKILTTALENNLLQVAVLEGDRSSFERLGRFDAISITEGGVTLGKEHGAMVRVSNKGDERKAAQLVGRVDFVIVDVDDWKVIPLENLIASFQHTQTRLIALVRDIEDAKLFFRTLEVGVHGVLLDPTGLDQIAEARLLLEETDSEPIDLVEAKITSVKPISMGDRVCIDTCSLLEIGEGMLVGSSSSGLFLVHSESVSSDYVESRPFRVNAGAVQSYILVPDGRTRYLSELKAGDEVLAVGKDGGTRSVVVGRVKIERRPLVLVEAEIEKTRFSVMLQNAETVRLVSSGEPVSIVDIGAGSSVMMALSRGGRHFGMKVDESIVER